MKNTYVNCKDWSWEDKLLYMKACIGDNLPHSKICGYVTNSKSELLSMYQGAHYIYCCDSGMIVFDRETKTPAIYDRNEVKLSDLKPKTKEVEWVNGDKCIYNDEEFTFVSYMCKPEEDHVVIWRSFSGIDVVYKTQISKPETEAERKEREEIEEASYLLSDWFNAIGKDMPEWSSVNEDVKAHYLRIVRKTNYKVKGE